MIQNRGLFNRDNISTSLGIVEDIARIATVGDVVGVATHQRRRQSVQCTPPIASSASTAIADIDIGRLHLQRRQAEKHPGQDRCAQRFRPAEEALDQR